MDTYRTVVSYFLAAILCVAVSPIGAHMKTASHTKQDQAKTKSAASEPNWISTGSGGLQVVSDFGTGLVSTGSAKKTSDGWKSVEIPAELGSEAGSEWRHGQVLNAASEWRQGGQTATKTSDGWQTVKTSPFTESRLEAGSEWRHGEAGSEWRRGEAGSEWRHGEGWGRASDWRQGEPTIHSVGSQAKTKSPASEHKSTSIGSADNRVVSDFVAGQVSSAVAKKTSDGWKNVGTSLPAEFGSEAGSEWRHGQVLNTASEWRQGGRTATKTSNGWQTVKTSQFTEPRLAGSEWRRGEGWGRASESHQGEQTIKTKTAKKIQGGQREGASESMAGEILSERGSW